MKFKEKITIDDFDGQKVRIRLVEPENNNKAIVTHYLHNFRNGVKKHYEKDAKKLIKEFVLDKFPEEKYSLVAEYAIQQLLFEVEKVPFPTPADYDFKFIDLFAGIGGFRLAMQNVKGKCVFTSEWDNGAQKTYRANFGETPFGDITKKTTKEYIPDDFDVLCAGFPCQAFSIAGKREGFEDTRGTLFFDLEEIIRNKRPKVVFLENVKNLQSHDSGDTFRIMLNVLEKKLKYKVFYKVLNTMTHANVPQNRERLFIVAFDPRQVKSWEEFQFPEEIPLTNTIHDFLEKGKQSDSLYYSKDHQYFPELKKTIKSRDTVYQWRRIYVRENKNNVCPTLTANMGAGGHNVPLILDNYGIRKLTPKECFALQGYPVDYRTGSENSYVLPQIANSRLYMQAGNSVTTTLIERIAKQIINVL